LKFTSLFVFLSILVLGCVTPSTWADIVPVQNASFEAPAPLIACGPGCFYNIGPIPDWTTAGPGKAGIWHPTSAYPPPDGGFIAYSNGGTISQTLATLVMPNTTYMLSVDIGHRPDGFANGFAIELDAGGVPLKSISGSNSLIPSGTFMNETLTFTTGATASGDLGIVLTSDGPQIDFDNVRLTATTVPEPSSLSLLAGGLGLLIFVFRRR
jgi:hapalindole biogenesis HpiC1 cyclase-like protein/PEP-CTERM motif-containing protein